MQYQNLLEQITQTCRQLFAENLTGVYLHDSLAMGCFNPKKSDLDLLIVVKEDIPDEQKLTFLNHVIRYNEQSPAKGLELSIVKNDACRPFLYPTPFLLHFSPMHLQWFQNDPDGYVKNMKGEDKDLAAHFTVIRQYGITLYGEKITDTFSEVPKELYWDSIWCDIENAREDITEDPMYMILNLCRVLAVAKEELILSKAQGAEWGIKNLPSRYHGLIQNALDCYTSDRNMTEDIEELTAFAEDMLRRIQAAIA